MEKHIILFDGECNFCSFWVKYVIKRDSKDVFRFTPLQSEKGKNYLKRFNMDEEVDSVVLIVDDHAYTKSTGALRILKTLGGFRSIFYGFIVVPTVVRDFFYDVMAASRYKLFGQQTCLLPQDINYKDKFL